VGKAKGLPNPASVTIALSLKKLLHFAILFLVGWTIGSISNNWIFSTMRHNCEAHTTCCAAKGKVGSPACAGSLLEEHLHARTF